VENCAGEAPQARVELLADTIHVLTTTKLLAVSPARVTASCRRASDHPGGHRRGDRSGGSAVLAGDGGRVAAVAETTGLRDGGCDRD